jgi:hypothetical protein
MGFRGVVMNEAGDLVECAGEVVKCRAEVDRSDVVASFCPAYVPRISTSIPIK